MVHTRANILNTQHNTIKRKIAESLFIRILQLWYGKLIEKIFSEIVIIYYLDNCIGLVVQY